MTTKTNIEAVNSGQTEREAFEAWNDRQDGLEFEDAEAEAHALFIFKAGWQARAAAQQAEPSTGICFFCGEPINGKHESDCPQADQSPAPASPSGEDAAEQSAAPIADDVEDDDIQPTPESERAAFNAMMRWHLIQLLQAWRYGGDLRSAGMAAFEWARTNDVGKAAFEASERAMKIAALPRAAEQADEAVTGEKTE